MSTLDLDSLLNSLGANGSSSTPAPSTTQEDSSLESTLLDVTNTGNIEERTVIINYQGQSKRLTGEVFRSYIGGPFKSLLERKWPNLSSGSVSQVTVTGGGAGLSGVYRVDALIPSTFSNASEDLRITFTTTSGENG